MWQHSMLGTTGSVASARTPAILQGVGSVRLASLRSCRYMTLLIRQAVSIVKYTKGLSRHQPATYLAIARFLLLREIEVSLLLASAVKIDHRLNTVMISLPVTKNGSVGHWLFTNLGVAFAAHLRGRLVLIMRRFSSTYTSSRSSEIGKETYHRISRSSLSGMGKQWARRR